MYLLLSLPGQAGKVVTQIIQGQPGSPASGAQIRGTTTQTVASPRATQGPVKLTLAQLTQLSQGTQVRHTRTCTHTRAPNYKLETSNRTARLLSK